MVEIGGHGSSRNDHTLHMTCTNIKRVVGDVRIHLTRSDDNIFHTINSPGGVDGAVDPLSRADVRQVKRPDHVGAHRLRPMVLAPVHVRPPRLRPNNRVEEGKGGERRQF